MPPPNCSTRHARSFEVSQTSQRITDLEATIRQMRQLSCILDSCTISASYEVSQAQKAILLMPRTAKGASTSSEELNAQISPRTDEEHNLPAHEDYWQYRSWPQILAALQVNRFGHRAHQQELSLGYYPRVWWLEKHYWADSERALWAVGAPSSFLTLAHVSRSVSPFFSPLSLRHGFVVVCFEVTICELLCLTACAMWSRGSWLGGSLVSAWCFCCFAHLLVWPCDFDVLPFCFCCHTMSRWYNVITLALISPWTGTCHASVWLFCFGLLCFALFVWVCLWFLFLFLACDDFVTDWTTREAPTPSPKIISVSGAKNEPKN